MNQKLNNLLNSRKFYIFITFMRIGTFVLIGIILYLFIKEIEAVKLMMYNPCKICMSKTGCQCFCMKFLNNSYPLP